jgi:hypothetical protein
MRRAGAKLPPPDLLSAPAAPIDIAVTPDTVDAAGEIISAVNGGTVTATGGDGTAYTLEIPPCALVFDTTITLTPVERFDGHAFVTQPSNTLGVSMEPDGLELFVPATLRVRPVEPVPDARFAAVDFLGDGREIAAVGYQLDGNELMFRVSHFSGLGGLWPVHRDWREQLTDARTTDPVRRIQSWVAGEIAEARDAGFPLDTEATRSVLQAALAMSEREFLDPLVRRASSSCEAATAAVRAFQAHNAQLALYGFEDDPTLIRKPSAELLNLLRDRCWAEAYQKCCETGDFEELATTLFGYFRQKLIMGETIDPDDEVRSTDYLTRCGRWTLELHGRSHTRRRTSF